MIFEHVILQKVSEPPEESQSGRNVVPLDHYWNPEGDFRHVHNVSGDQHNVHSAAKSFKVRHKI
jgi:hypothetical protein